MSEVNAKRLSPWVWCHRMGSGPTGLDNSRYGRSVIRMIIFYLAVAILALAVFVIAGYATVR